MADHPSQVRQLGNLGNTPAGQFGYASGSRGNSYYEFATSPESDFHPSRSISLASTAVTPAGTGAFNNSGGGQYYADLAAKMDASLFRPAKAGGIFGGTKGESGVTQGDTGTLPIPPTTVYYLRAQDQNCLPTISYVYWTSTIISLSSYTGALPCGGPLINLTVLAQRIT